MGDQQDERSYSAQLVFASDDGGRECEERTIRAPNAEVAYRKAVLLGIASRPERRFLGLASLTREAATDEEPPAASRRKTLRVVARSKLEAIGATDEPELSETETARLLGEPPPVVLLDRLDDIPWGNWWTIGRRAWLIGLGALGAAARFRFTADRRIVISLVY